MENSHTALRLVLDSMTEHIVVINGRGEIQYVNKTWQQFGSRNECSMEGDWHGVNYIAECDRASAMGDDFGTKAAKGIRSVINHDRSSFYFEYPCHSPDKKRWFMMRVSPFIFSDEEYFVISHQNITERKLAEEEVANLAHLDGLTSIANRRSFETFLKDEWRRCVRLKKSIGVAILDLDHFKCINDSYGHQRGDECLIQVAKTLQEYSKRPGDICARYGGEEFVLVWGDTNLDQSHRLCQKILLAIEKLQIPNINSPTAPYLTASMGLVTIIPTRVWDENELVGVADTLLYKAKAKGRNRVQSKEITLKQDGVSWKKDED